MKKIRKKAKKKFLKILWERKGSGDENSNKKKVSRKFLSVKDSVSIILKKDPKFCPNALGE